MLVLCTDRISTFLKLCLVFVQVCAFENRNQNNLIAFAVTEIVKGPYCLGFFTIRFWAVSQMLVHKKLYFEQLGIGLSNKEISYSLWSVQSFMFSQLLENFELKDRRSRLPQTEHVQLESLPENILVTLLHIYQRTTKWKFFVNIIQEDGKRIPWFHGLEFW